MEIVAEYASRAHARMDEREMEKMFPGPWNRVPWAGTGIEHFAGFGFAVVTEDPITAGAEFGEIIDPYVKGAHEGFNGFARTRWLDDEDAVLLKR